MAQQLQTLSARSEDKVQSPAPTSETSQPPVTPVLGDMIASRFCECLNTCGTHKLT